EMSEFLEDPRGALEVRAVMPNGPLVANDCRVADRASGRHLEFPFASGPLVEDGSDDLGDDVARLLENDVVADPDVLSADLVEVVESCAGDGRAGNLRWTEMCDRGEGARSADEHSDVLDDGLDLLGRKFVGDRPTRRP